MRLPKFGVVKPVSFQLGYTFLMCLKKLDLCIWCIAFNRPASGMSETETLKGEGVNLYTRTSDGIACLFSLYVPGIDVYTCASH